MLFLESEKSWQDELAGFYGKLRKKMVSTSWKINGALARINFFFENFFLLIPIMVFTSRKIALIKKTVSIRQKIRFH